MKTSFFLPLSLIAALTACHQGPSDENAEPVAKTDGNQVVLPSEQVASISVEPVQKCVSAVTRLNGRLVWDEDVTVRIFTPFGGRVSKVAAEIGQRVASGAPLALIASPDFGQAQADARRAHSDFALAERNLTRLKELFAHGAAPEKDVQSAEADYDRAQAEKQRALARLTLYGGATESVDQSYVLKSPLDGVVVERNINPGQEVRADAMLANTEKLAAPLFVVTDPSRLWIEIDAFEQDLPKLKEGAEIVIRSRALPDHTFAGKIRFVSDFLDPVRKVITVRGSVDNPQRLLKAEMFVNVELPQGGQTAGLDVPEKAVFSKGEKRYVFLERGTGRFERQEVKVGPEHDGKVLVVDGLQLGQRVVTEGCLLLDQTLTGGT